MQDLRIVFLGTSAGTPSRERNVAAVAVVLDGTVLLFDCGEGTQHQLLRAPVRTGSIEAIFLTHLHGDHVYGLPGLLATMSMNGRSRPLDLIGPEGTREYLEATLRTSHHNPMFEIRVGEPPYRGDGFTVETAPMQHSVPCLGYRVIEDDKPGEFDPEKARALGIPHGPQWGELQRARDPRVTGPVRKGRRIVYCTDTVPCEAAVELARDADVLIHEATYDESMATEAQERFHSTAAGAARIAREANVRQLLITHFSTRYREVEALVDEARAVFPRTEAASDFLEVPVR
jgi:ribonuclease Z